MRAEFAAVAEQGPEHVDEAAGERKERLAMDEVVRLACGHRTAGRACWRGCWTARPCRTPAEVGD